MRVERRLTQTDLLKSLTGLLFFISDQDPSSLASKSSNHSNMQGTSSHASSYEHQSALIALTRITSDVTVPGTRTSKCLLSVATTSSELNKTMKFVDLTARERR